MKKEPATTEWLRQLGAVLREGKEVAPRGQPTLELRNSTVEYEASQPVVCIPERGLSRAFLSAEPLWILSGSDKIEDIAPYNPKMKNYSDDGTTLFGAYGPPIMRQLDHVVGVLTEDASTRQAVLTIWRECPPPTLDVPCTLGMTFAIRDDVISSTVLMRSSDVWLGLPYDMFTFAAVLYRVAAEVAEERRVALELGRIAIHASSSHLYLRDVDAARAIVSGKVCDESLARSMTEMARTTVPGLVYGMECYRRFAAELAEARDAKVLPALARIG